MLKKLYGRAYDECGVTQAEFVNLFNSSVAYLVARYGAEYVAPFGAAPNPVSAVTDELPVREIYLDAVYDGIVAAKTKAAARKVDFIEKSEFAYRTVWREKAKRKKIRGEDW